MAEHAALAPRQCRSGAACRDGDLVRLAPGGTAIIDEVPAGRPLQGWLAAGGAEERTVADRRRLGFAGVVSVALALGERGELIADPEPLTGVPRSRRGGSRFEEIAYDAAIEAFKSMPRNSRRDPEAVAEAVRRAVRAALAAHWNKKPICHVHVLEV